MNEESQTKLDALEAEKAALNPNNPDDRFRATIIDQEIAGIREKLAAEDRLQQQAAEVAEIELPLDYDEVWGVPGANDEIRSLIRQTKEQLFAKHNDELERLVAEQKEQFAAVQEQASVANDQVQALEAGLAHANELLSRETSDKLTALERLAEAEKKRDNAVVLMEEAQAERDRAQAQVKGLNGQINELESMLRTYRSQASGGYAGGLKLTSTIKPESDEERASRQERERIDAANRALARFGAEPLQLPTNPAFQEVATAAEEPKDETFHSNEEAQHSDGLDEADSSLEVAGETPSLEERVAALEAWKDTVEERLAGLAFDR